MVTNLWHRVPGESSEVCQYSPEIFMRVYQVVKEGWYCEIRHLDYDEKRKDPVHTKRDAKVCVYNRVMNLGKKRSRWDRVEHRPTVSRLEMITMVDLPQPYGSFGYVQLLELATTRPIVQWYPSKVFETLRVAINGTIIATNMMGQDHPILNHEDGKSYWLRVVDPKENIRVGDLMVGTEWEATLRS